MLAQDYIPPLAGATSYSLEVEAADLVPPGLETHGYCLSLALVFLDIFRRIGSVVLIPTMLSASRAGTMDPKHERATEAPIVAWMLVCETLGQSESGVPGPEGTDCEFSTSSACCW